MNFKLPKIFYSKLFMGMALILLAIVFTVELRQWQQRQVINREIDYLITEKKGLEQKNQDLEQSLQYFSSETYKEKLAREQLGLQKEGEIVVNFPKLAEQVQMTDTADSKPSNFEKWWEYFFIKNGRQIN